MVLLPQRPDLSVINRVWDYMKRQHETTETSSQSMFKVGILHLYFARSFLHKRYKGRMGRLSCCSFKPAAEASDGAES